MVEQPLKNVENTSTYQHLPADEAHGAAQKMLQCIQLHSQSTAKDGYGKFYNDAAVISDQQSINNANAIKTVNGQILELLAANKPIGDDLKNQCITLHTTSRDLNNSDTTANGTAQARDLKDMHAEQMIMNSDRWLLRDKHLSPALHQLVEKDIESKTQVHKIELKDMGDQQKNIAANDVDNKWNKAVIDALTSNSPQLATLLQGDIASKDSVIVRHREARNNEQFFAATHHRDQTLNTQLNDALQHDPYFASARRQDAGLPIWTTEDKLRQAEYLQHERRRLHLEANSTPEQIRTAQIVDMNKQLHLPPWATKEQRIEARKLKEKREPLIAASYEHQS